MNPNPQVAENKCDRHEYQSQVRISRASVNPCLATLSVRALDSEAFAVQFSDVSGRAVYTPCCKKKFLFFLFAILAVAVRSIRHTNFHRYLSFAIFQCVRVPTCSLTFDPMQTG